MEMLDAVSVGSFSLLKTVGTVLDLSSLFFSLLLRSP
jgi:hypothetical protein